jgi:hypothetical protein
MPGEAAGLEQIARGVEVHLGAELEVLLRAAGDQRGEVEYGVDLRRYQRPGELRVGEVAKHRRRRGLIGGHHLVRRQRRYQSGTDVARRPGDEYSHGDQHSN